MELDFKKKIIIGCFVAVVLLISGYLYYEYINSNNPGTIIESNSNENSEDKGSVVKKAVLNEIENKEEDIIIVHIAGAVCNPRNCKN